MSDEQARDQITSRVVCLRTVGGELSDKSQVPEAKGGRKEERKEAPQVLLIIF